MRKRVLLVNGGKPEPIRILEQDPEVELLALTDHEYRYMIGAGTETVAIEDTQDLEAARKAVLRLAAGRDIDYVVAPGERGQLVAAYLRSYFGVPGTGLEVATAFTNKDAMKKALRAAGLPVADSRLITGLDRLADAGEEIGWPVVVKPVVGSGTALTFLIRSAAEAAGFLRTSDAAELGACGQALLVEKFVRMTKEYHCDGIVSGGEVAFALPSCYFDPLLGNLDRISGSYTLPEDDPDQEEILRLNARAVRALGLEDGATHLELFRTGTGFVIGEIACRPAGGGVPEAVLRHCGVDLWAEMVRVCTGGRADIRPRRTDKVTLNVMIPPEEGRVVEMTPAERFLEIPGVTRAEIRARPGDVLESPKRSTVMAALLFVELPGIDVMEDRLAQIAGAHKLVTEPV
ncbi:ATP-grasp domain-containing protein [Streptomyces demainii]|uniref:Biotin carboxylase n=1 Tax=Streptomyces demainii TaxID=588122 RepID=A0ABT9KU33_9ACTN|nr:ATP-grasp domain-containing protein [Streptomyces demainii]MDP9611955.1 biotin carboxylase [Streptomyces demainii]